jgi:hypothetical protein
MDELVPDKPDRPTREARQSGHGDGVIPLHHPFDRHQSVRQASPGRGRASRGSRLNLERLDHLPVFDQLHVAPNLPDNRTRVAAHERIAPQMFAALDRLEQERLARPAYFAIGRERGLDISQQLAGNRDEVALGSQFEELFECGGVHVGGLRAIWPEAG